jgi:hypothetical protein
VRSSGWLGSVEVVEVEYDPKLIDYAALLRHAKKSGAASSVFTRSAEEDRAARAIFGDKVRPFAGKLRPVKDTRYYARRTALKHLPLTRGQLSRANSYLKGRSLTDLMKRDILSPGQKLWLQKILAAPKRAWPLAIEKAADIAHWRLRQFVERK